MSESHDHVASLGLYFTIFAALMVLTAVTVAVAYVDLGSFNILVALTIAIVKATLVVLFFMHLLYSERLNWVFAAAGFAWLFLLIGIMAADPLSRGWLPVPGF